MKDDANRFDKSLQNFKEEMIPFFEALKKAGVLDVTLRFGVSEALGGCRCEDHQTQTVTCEVVSPDTDPVSQEDVPVPQPECPRGSSEDARKTKTETVPVAKKKTPQTKKKTKGERVDVTGVNLLDRFMDAFDMSTKEVEINGVTLKTADVIDYMDVDDLKNIIVSFELDVDVDQPLDKLREDVKKPIEAHFSRLK